MIEKIKLKIANTFTAPVIKVALFAIGLFTALGLVILSTLLM